MSHLYYGGKSVGKLRIRMIVYVYSFLSFLLGSALLFSSPAQAVDGFTVQGVAVDAKGSSATSARDAGLLQGQSNGLRLLLQRMTQPSEHARLPSVSTADIPPYVLSVSVDDEKTQANRYTAHLTIRYEPQAVRTLLQSHGISYIEPHRAILTLPLLQAEGRKILWEDPNPWRQAWASLAVDPLIPLLVPMGGIEDVTELPTNRIADLTINDLSAILQRHDASDAIVITADLDHATTPMQLAVSLRGIGSTLPDFQFPRTFSAHDGETIDAFVTRVAGSVSTAMVTAYKGGNVTNHQAQENTLRAAVRFTGLVEWQAIRERLERTTTIRRIEIEALTRGEALLTLHIVGDAIVLPNALAQQGLSFTPAGNTESQRALITLRAPIAPLSPPSPSELEPPRLDMPE